MQCSVVNVQLLIRKVCDALRGLQRAPLRLAAESLPARAQKKKKAEVTSFYNRKTRVRRFLSLLESVQFLNVKSANKRTWRVSPVSGKRVKCLVKVDVT